MRTQTPKRSLESLPRELPRVKRRGDVRYFGRLGARLDHVNRTVSLFVVPARDAFVSLDKLTTWARESLSEFQGYEWLGP